MALPWVELRRAPENFPDFHVAKVQSDRTVAGYEVSGEGRIYMKRSLVKKPVRRLFFHYLPSKEWREFELARQFAGAGLMTPEPVFYAEGVWEDESYRGPVTFLASRALPDDFQDFLRYSRRQNFKDRLQSLALFTRQLHERGVLHGDYRADHLFFHEDQEQWALIDLDGSRVGGKISKDERWRALEQLFISLVKSELKKTHVTEFLRSYDPENRFGFSSERLFQEAKKKDR